MAAGLDDFVERVSHSRSPLEAALTYAEQGWPVLPVAGVNEGACGCGRACDSRAKHPLTRHGVHDATSDSTEVRRWWRRWPDANVGIATGAHAQLAVVDVDLNRRGRESLARLRTLGHVLPFSFLAYTGGGGLHLFYRQPADMTVPNTVGRLPNVRTPLPGIDLRGDGGYVVAPPSVHATGHPYRWRSRQPRRLASLPRWLWPPPPPPPGSADVPRRHRSSGGTPYGAAALIDEVDAVRHLEVGERNDGLNRSAFALGRLVAGGELAEDLVYRQLLAAAVAVGLEEGEVQRTIRSGLRGGARCPRIAPDPSPSHSRAGKPVAPTPHVVAEHDEGSQ